MLDLNGARMDEEHTSDTTPDHRIPRRILIVRDPELGYTIHIAYVQHDHPTTSVHTGHASEASPTSQCVPSTFAHDLMRRPRHTSGPAHTKRDPQLPKQYNTGHAIEASLDSGTWAILPSRQVSTHPVLPAHGSARRPMTYSRSRAYEAPPTALVRKFEGLFAPFTSLMRILRAST